MTRESTIVTNIRNMLRTEFNAYTVKYSPYETGRRGTADILACVSGTFLALECKRPGGEATLQQRASLWAVYDAGGIAAVVESVDQARQYATHARLHLRGAFRAEPNTPRPGVAEVVDHLIGPR